MAKFMLVLGGPGEHGPRTDPPFVNIMRAYGAWAEALASRGLLHSTHALFAGEGRRLVPAGNGRVTDGPYAETKETIGGFFVIEARDYDAACEIAKDCPTVKYQGGYCDVRRISI